MFLRPFRFSDKRKLQQLYYDTVHQILAQDYCHEQIMLLAPEVPDRDVWTQLDRQDCFIVEYKQQVLGFASMDNLGLITFLFVHKDFQNKGIASTLLKQLERLARKKQFEQIKVEPFLTSKTFFEAKGFSLIGEVEKSLCGTKFITFIMSKKVVAQAIKNTKT